MKSLVLTEIEGEVGRKGGSLEIDLVLEQDRPESISSLFRKKD